MPIKKIKSPYGKTIAVKILWWTFYFKKWKRYLSNDYRVYLNRKNKIKRKSKSKTCNNSKKNRLKVRRQLTQRDGYKCKNCMEEDGLTIDHIIPLYKTGKEGDVLSNKQFLCGRCHTLKNKLDNPIQNEN